MHSLDHKVNFYLEVLYFETKHQKFLKLSGVGGRFSSQTWSDGLTARLLIGLGAAMLNRSFAQLQSEKLLLLFKITSECLKMLTRFSVDFVALELNPVICPVT